MKGIDVAKQHIGQQQNRDNQVLKDFFSDNAINGDIAIDPATTSWCAVFVNACEREAGNPGTGKQNAQSFCNYGQFVKFDDAQEGDIVVFHFPFDSTWQGHVTYFVEWDDANNTVKCLGGNQHHMADYSNYVQDYITDIRRF